MVQFFWAHPVGHIEDRFLRVKWPNQQSQSTEGRKEQLMNILNIQLAMYVQMLDIFRKYKKNPICFNIFENITIFSNPVSVLISTALSSVSVSI